MRQNTNPGTTATAHRLKAVAVDMARYHLTPLTLLEATAFVAALLLGWREIAVVILAWHVLRMVVTALADRRGNEVRDPG